MIGQLIAALVATACLHEAGHLAIALALRLPCRPILTRYGPGARIGCANLDLTRWQVRLTAAGGPAANLALAFGVCYPLHLGLMALLNIAFAAINLLPIPRSDGTKILRPGRAIAIARAREALS